MRARTSRTHWLPALVVTVIAATVAADGQAPATRPAGQAATAAPDPYAGLAFRNIGPAVMGGRIDDLAVLESNPAVFYVGSATGGLWRTTNNGTTWDVLFDDLDDVVSIGDIAIPPGDANTVWVGSGENNNRQSGSWGNGVYKSTDAGRTWKLMGLGASRHIARIIVDPVDHDVVYVAALGSLWGPGKERGVFKTTDGGLTWTSVLFVNEDTGATELVMDPANNKVLYAATYQRRRATWGFNGGGPGSAIYKSSDAGRTWTKLTQGIPTGPLGRIGMDVYRANPNILYARIEHEKESGTYRSDDAGLSWRKVSNVNPRPMYFSQIRVDPTNDLRVYVLGVQLHISDDGGKTFIENGAMHSDHHAMWINPANPNHIIDGNDGGVGLSYDKGATWEAVTNMDLGQFYHVAYDMQTPYHVCGGLQDNYTWCGPSAVRSRTGIGNDEWRQIQGGDGFEAQMDPRDGRTVYAESQDGNIVRVDRVTGERKSIRPVAARGEPPLRWNWNTPIVLSTHNPDTLYVGANKVFKSTDRGQNWTAISPDLTQNVDRETLTLMGVTAKAFTVAKHDGVQSYGNLVQLVESPRQAGTLYAGADDGSVYMTKDDGKSWTNITSRFPGLPKDAYVSRLAASTHDTITVYATFDNHRNHDLRIVSRGECNGQCVTDTGNRSFCGAGLCSYLNTFDRHALPRPEGLIDHVNHHLLDLRGNRGTDGPGHHSRLGVRKDSVVSINDRLNQERMHHLAIVGDGLTYHGQLHWRHLNLELPKGAQRQLSRIRVLRKHRRSDRKRNLDGFAEAKSLRNILHRPVRKGSDRQRERGVAGTGKSLAEGDQSAAALLLIEVVDGGLCAG